MASDDPAAFASIGMRDKELLSILPKDEELPKLESFIGQFCRKHALSEKMHAELSLILEELFVNSAHYGFTDGREKTPSTIELGFDGEKKSVHLMMIDAGRKFDPTQRENQELVSSSLADEDLPIGGLGILLVKKKTDHMEYRYSGHNNIIHLIKAVI